MNRDDAFAGFDQQRAIVIDAHGGPSTAGESDRLADGDTGARVLVVTPVIGVGRHTLQEEGGPQGGKVFGGIRAGIGGQDPAAPAMGSDHHRLTPQPTIVRSSVDSTRIPPTLSTPIMRSLGQRRPAMRP